MKLNVGGTDRLLRVIAGLIIVILGVVYSSWWGLIGIILMATGIFQFCPLYALLKLNTLKKKE